MASLSDHSSLTTAWDQTIFRRSLLNYAGPSTSKPTNGKRGVSQHPHRGFETVTIVFKEEQEHRDTSGGGEVIVESDVQWIRAGAHSVYEEFHSQLFSEKGGTLEMMQLRINFLAKA